MQSDLAKIRLIYTESHLQPGICSQFGCNVFGVAHQILVADATEAEAAEALEIALKNEAPLTYVKRVTALKLDAAVESPAVSGYCTRITVLCAEATSRNGTHKFVAGKPETEKDAVRMLTELSGHNAPCEY
ncbi:MAG: Maf family protein [Polaromonas sp.]|nr:Maf family protein [Polaromonas sp.]